MKYTFQDVDERIVKTRFALSDAVLNLIKKENKIKVLDICHEANITPMTYYHHFGNKQELLEFSIKEQLCGILPIPKKLKPTSLKHLINYLIFSFNRFITDNRDLFYCAIQQAYENKYLGSYFDLISKIIKRLIKQEVALLIKTNNLYIEFYANIISGSMEQLFKHIVLDKITISSDMLWGSFKNIFLSLQ